jgi:5-methylcytosine-specific restriction endonuclease McrA
MGAANIPFAKPPARVTRRERLGNPRERVPPRVRAAVWARDRGRCGQCGRLCDPARGERWEAHRLVPGAVGGRYRLGNIVTLCRACHRATLAGAPRNLAEAQARAKIERLSQAAAAYRAAIALRLRSKGA